MANSAPAGETETSPKVDHHEVRKQLSRRMVALLKQHYGRGPEFSKTYVNDDTILILMRGGFSQVEETLLAGGMGEAVHQQREAFQALMRPRFEEMILEVTGRHVVAFLSANHQDPDIMAELFILDSTDLLDPVAPDRVA